MGSSVSPVVFKQTPTLSFWDVPVCGGEGVWAEGFFKVLLGTELKESES